jgi:circadian clock protein KaiB
MTAMPDDDAPTRWYLTLYVSGASARSVAALEAVRRIIDEDLPGQVELQIVDVHDEPALVVHDGILAVPTLVKRLPEPLRKLVGDLSNTARVRVGLGLPPGRPDERLERQP